MSTQHTPGPWAAHQFGSPEQGDFTIGTDYGADFHNFSTGYVRGIPEARANARLIAAAPDLLEVNGDFMRARAAIAKARGDG